MYWVVGSGLDGGAGDEKKLDSLILVSHFHEQDSTSWQWLLTL